MDNEKRNNDIRQIYERMKRQNYRSGYIINYIMELFGLGQAQVYKIIKGE